MITTITNQRQINTKTFIIFIVSSLLFFSVLQFSGEINNTDIPVNNEQTNQQKQSGKNEKHSNQKARESAKQKYEQTKDELDKLKRKPNKTKQDKIDLQKLEKQVKHWKEKLDFTGENHSQTYKGN
jgi:TolA-binding protein